MHFSRFKRPIACHLFVPVAYSMAFSTPVQEHRLPLDNHTPRIDTETEVLIQVIGKRLTCGQFPLSCIWVCRSVHCYTAEYLLCLRRSRLGAVNSNSSRSTPPSPAARHAQDRGHGFLWMCDDSKAQRQRLLFNLNSSQVAKYVHEKGLCGS
ncbi:hypothetical protein B0T24DRAFT_114144 [Lasiosphaeria ovina]|uniref:Uncharacterized protein n=1 Tax=Lasiosphaeria ovina TaxID=92902 RepID=A0AAE0JU08_9PEZI|nr:hypothetical protein B0T24DRAFT_114144 [Lasiosphaeria ovina]